MSGGNMGHVIIPSWLDIREVEKFWQQLGRCRTEARLSRHREGLTCRAEKSVPFLRAQYSLPSRPALLGCLRLLDQLDDDTFDRRERAFSALREVGEPAHPFFVARLRQPGLSLESRSRISRLITALEASPHRRQLRCALTVLEYIHTPSACALLKRLAGGDTRSWLTINAKASLRRASSEKG